MCGKHLCFEHHARPSSPMEMYLTISKPARKCLREGIDFVLSKTEGYFAFSCGTQKTLSCPKLAATIAWYKRVMYLNIESQIFIMIKLIFAFAMKL